MKKDTVFTYVAICCIIKLPAAKVFYTVPSFSARIVFDI